MNGDQSTDEPRRRADGLAWWGRRPYVHLVRFVAVAAVLFGISEFLLVMFPCFYLVALSGDPFFCPIVVATFVGEVGFFYEVRHYPVLAAISLVTVVWWALKENKKQKPPTTRT